MNTISTISSISWNTVPFFESTIARLHSSGVIDWCHWIYHQPEEDEKKGHIHFVLQPSRRIDTSSLEKEFVEPVCTPAEARKLVKEYLARGESLPNDVVLPRGVNPFRKTGSMKDWFLYAMHDVKYLLGKGQSRQHHYSRADIQSTHDSFVDELLQECVDPLGQILTRVVEMRDKGYTLGSILATGLVPANLAMMAKIVYEDAETNRNGRSGHDEQPIL